MIEGRKDFDRSWLQTKLDPHEHFAHLLGSRLAERSPPFREGIEENRAQILDVLRDGDELWYWRLVIGQGPSGADGYAILRGGEIAHVWTRACIC